MYKLYKDIIPSELALFVPFQCPAYVLLVVGNKRLVSKVYKGGWGFSSSLMEFLCNLKLEKFRIEEIAEDLPPIKWCVIRGRERPDCNLRYRCEILCKSQLSALGEVLDCDVEIGKIAFETEFKFVDPKIQIHRQMEFVNIRDISFPLVLISNHKKEVIEFLNSLRKKYIIYEGESAPLVRKMNDFLVVLKVNKFNTLIKELAKEKNVILLADSPIDGFNTVHLGLPTFDDRKLLIRQLIEGKIEYVQNEIDPSLKKFEDTIGIEVQFRTSLAREHIDNDELELAALKTRGLSIADIEQVIRTSKLRFGDCQLSNVISIAANSNPCSLVDIISKIPNKKFSDFFGIDGTINYLNSNIVQPFKNPLKFKNIVSPPKGVLIYGVSGSGKTSLGIAIANETKLPTIALSAAELRSKIVGEAEEKIRRLFQQARSSQPCILLIENFDMVCPKRTENSGIDKRIVTTFLTEMDGILNSGGVFVIAITGNLEIIDEAVRRPGRLDIHIELRNLDEFGRNAILVGRLQNVQNSISKTLIDNLASKLNGCSNAYVASLIDRAAINAIKRGSESIDEIDFKNLSRIAK